jgi:hypothetical protein
LPFLLSLRDTDKTADANPTKITPIIMGPSPVFVTSSHYYNGFQVGNRDSAAKADKNAQTIRLLVDFTSIKDYELYISENPQVFFTYHDLKNSGDTVTQNIGNATMISKGLYFVEKKDMRENEVIRIEFSNDFETISNLS